MRKVRNFGKSWSFTPAAIARPANEQELAEVVREATKVRVMGSAHSWSKAIVTGDILLSLDRMNKLVAVDREGLRVRAQAGIKLKDLIAQLEKQGLALANLGSIADQSLGGAISTGTHGTGLGFSCLAAQVEAFKLIDAGGNEQTLEKGDAHFAAVLVGLGCFGVIHEMTLAVVPTFQMHAITDTVSFDEVIENLDAFTRGYDHFKFWWLVPSDDVIVFKNQRTNEPRNDSDFTRWFKDDFLAVIVYRSLIALEKINRRKLVPVFNRFLGKEVGKHFDRVCKSHVGFLTPSPPVHRETEWAFDYADAKALLTQYRAHLCATGHTYNFIQEIRFTKADDFWLSPAFGRDSMWLSMYNIDSAHRWDEQRTSFEAFAKARGGRPHWGKEADIDPAYLRAQWPRLDEFWALARRYDPQGKFLNAWALEIFGGD